MPGGGRTDGKGTVVLEPLNVQVTLSTREAPIEPYQAYFPFAARFAGLFSGDSLSEIQRGPKGELILASRGTAWASNLAVRAPGAQDDVARMDAMVIRDLDFSWPNYALVDRVVLTHPQIRVERDAEGTINLRALFAPRPETEKKGDAVAPAAEAAASKSPDAGAEPAAEDGEKAPGGGGPAQTMVIDFNEIDIENGFARFIDHTTKPPFSEDISRLAVTIKSLSNVMGRAERTTLTLQALVGSDGALDMRGDLSGLGESLRADLVAELRGFSLSTANPYADALTSWTVQRGKLQAKIHYRVEGDRITAEHDLEFNKLAVLKSSGVVRRGQAQDRRAPRPGRRAAHGQQRQHRLLAAAQRHAQRPELRLGRGDLGGGEAGPRPRSCCRRSAPSGGSSRGATTASTSSRSTP